jgi:CheY-like chemotaxis protein
LSADLVKRILIVDDAEEILATMAEFLRDEGYEVACALSGRDALRVLQATQALPDLILLDLMMPDMDGHEFREEQQRSSRLSHIPVLLMSAGTDLMTRAVELGARGYLKKPFRDLPTILDAIRRCL